MGNEKRVYCTERSQSRCRWLQAARRQLQPPHGPLPQRAAAVAAAAAHRLLPTSASTSSTLTGTPPDSTSWPEAARVREGWSHTSAAAAAFTAGGAGSGRRGGRSMGSCGGRHRCNSSCTAATQPAQATPASTPAIPCPWHPLPLTRDGDVVLDAHANAGQGAIGLRVIWHIQPRLDGQHHAWESRGRQRAGRDGQGEQLGERSRRWVLGKPSQQAAGSGQRAQPVQAPRLPAVTAGELQPSTRTLLCAPSPLLCALTRLEGPVVRHS